MECNHFSSHTSIQSCLFTSAFKTKKCNLILFIKIHQMIRDKIIIFFNPPKTNRKFIQYRIEKWKKNDKKSFSFPMLEKNWSFVWFREVHLLYDFCVIEVSIIIYHFIYGIIVSMVGGGGCEEIYSIKLNSMKIFI